LGVYGRENVSSTKTLLTDKNICSKHLFGHGLKSLCAETNKQGVLIRVGVGKIFKINQRGHVN